MMAADESTGANALLINRLNKLYKNVLIDILVNRTVPEDITCEVTKGFFENLFSSNEEDCFQDSVSCPTIPVLEINRNHDSSKSGQKDELSTLRNEVTVLNKLTSHLESRISDQTFIIELLKSERNSKNVNYPRYRGNSRSADSQTVSAVSADKIVNLKTIDKPPTADFSKQTGKKRTENLHRSAGDPDGGVAGLIRKTQEKKVSDNQAIDLGMVQRAIQQVQTRSAKESNSDLMEPIPASGGGVAVVPRSEDSAGWRTVTRAGVRRRRGRGVTGSGECAAVKGVPEVVHLHVCRISPDTSAETLVGVLRSHFPEVTCESLNSKRPDIYSSFKVSVYRSHFNKAMDASIWPCGAYVSQFFHRRRIENNSS